MTTDVAGARHQFADAISKALPARPGGRPRYKVLAAARELDVPEANVPVVLLLRLSVRRDWPNMFHEFAVWVIEPKTMDADDDLDEALDDVVQAVDAYPGVFWTTAERKTYRDQPAYRLTATVVSPYKKQETPST